MSKLVIDFSADYVAAAKLNGGKLEDFFAFATDTDVSDVFAGRVENVRGGDCFINYDITRPNGILHMRSGQKFKVGDFLKCQVVREADGDKGAVLSDYINIAGGFSVLCGGVVGYKFSRRLTADEKKRLETCLPPAAHGFILRKQAAEAAAEEIIGEMAELASEYSRLSAVRTGNAIERLRHIESADRILIETEAYSCEVLANKRFSAFGREASVFEGGLFDYLGGDGVVDRLFDRRVRLKNGAELVFDQTEAMTVIDINSSGNFGGNIDAVNTAAAVEAVKQIRLRNLSGLILIDFIGGGRENLTALLDELCRDDREKCSVYEISALSLVAISRKRRYNDFKRLFFEKCPLCGDGEIRKKE